MRVRGWSRHVFALVWLAAGATACLPRGDGPVGRQVVTGRARSLAGVLPARAPDDGALRLLVSQPGDTVYDVDLYLITVPDAGAPSERLLVERWGGGFCGEGPCVDTDSRGRLFVWSNVGGIGSSDEALTRIDLDTGDRLELGLADGLYFSQSRTRVLVSRPYPDPSYDLIEADDTSTRLPIGGGNEFVGDDFYFLDAGTLRRFAPGGTPETLRTGVQSFSALYTPDGVRLLISGAVDDPFGPKPLSLLDPATGVEQPLPFDSTRVYGLSPDGGWVLLIPAGAQYVASDFSLFELATGHEEAFQIPFRLDSIFWRPGHTELWLLSSDVQSPGDIATSIKVPGQPVVATPVPASPFGGALPSVFTSDGRHWYSEVRSSTGGDTIFVGDADDPSAPRFRVNPEGSSTFGAHELPDVRLLVEAYYYSPNRSDIHLVDPNDGATRVLGREGGLLANGARRVLALLHVANGTGDLTAIDVDGDRSTVLAAEFGLAAFVQPPPPGASPVEPGARVAFQFRARFDSPYDGIWVTPLP